MQRKFNAGTRSGLLLCLFILAAVAGLTILPYQFRSEAGTKKGLRVRTESADPSLPNFDIRDETTKDGSSVVTNYRQATGKDASFVADIRDEFVRGEESLRSSVPTLKIEYSPDLRSPEVIGPDTDKKIAFLTGPSRPAGEKHADVLINFLKQNSSLIGATAAQIDDLDVFADYTNPDGNLSWVELNQRINGVPVFRGEVKAGFTKSGQLIRVLNNIAPGIDYNTVSRDFGAPEAAFRFAAANINHQIKAEEQALNAGESTDLKAVFGNGDWATTAEKMYFPTEPGVVVPAYRVLIWEPVNAYYVIVDANTGVALWRKNITNDQTQAATYNVYTNPASMVNIAKNPAPIVPGIIDPGLGTQGTIIARNNVTLIGNEAPNTFNNNGWITDGANGANGFTDGNAVEAGLDIDGVNGVDAPVAGVARSFNFAYNPAPGAPSPGDAPTLPAYRSGAVTQLFYINNRYHDALYQLGFTEAARNFQNDNFGRGGVAADRVSGEAQDSSGTNNANFATPADGGRGRMQMYTFTGPTPDYDGDLDADIVVHEHTHGLSNRLVGNGSGLTNNRGGSMGEGWSDFYGLSLLSNPSTPAGSINTTGDWATYLLTASYTYNYYYGIRRFPYALLSFTGGPSNRPHSPQTFADIDAAQINNADGAYGRNLTFANTATEVHNAGEVWCSALFEARGRFIARLGATAGNLRMLQLTTDGMKLTPSSPNFIQARDAIVAAAQAAPVAPQAAADVVDVREGFRIRGMGFGAVDNNTSVIESFASASLAASAPAVTSGNNLLEPNECNTVNVPLTNNAGVAATGITAVLSTTTPGITVTQPNSAYADIPPGGGPVNNTTAYQVSVDNTVACFTQANFTLTVTYTGGGGGSPAPFTFSLPVGLQGLNYAFASSTSTIPAGGVFVTGSAADDAAVAVTLPSGWTSTVYGTPVTSLSANTNGTMTVNGTSPTAFTNTVLPGAAFGIGLFPYWDDLDMDAADVTGGGIFANTVGSAPNRQFYVEWRAQHFSETANGPITTNFAILLTEGSDVVRYIYPSTGIAAQAGGASATVGIQAAATGTQFTQFSFNTASLTAGGLLTATRPAGMCTPGSGTCTAAVARSRADFDGDGRSDLSVFRPSEGNWYLNRSTAGFSIINWGNSSDTIVPGDYDGDGKADTAVFRPSSDPAVSDYLILNSNGFVFRGFAWGVPADVPVTGDYDGDGKTDLALFRPSTNTWFVLNSSNGSNTVQPFGTTGDRPVAIDNDGDGRTNLAIYRPSENTWYIARPTGTPATNFDAIPFGIAGDQLVQADYTGDNREDVAVFRPSNGTWYIRNSATGAITFTSFGTSGDVAVPGDYDGDGRDDLAVYRGGTWYVQRSTAGSLVQAFGLATDVPVPVRYLPPAAGGGGGGSPVTVSYTGPAVAITDNLPAGINIVVPVSGVGTISDLNFSFDGTAASADPLSTTVGLNHSFVGDIIVRLTSPTGTTVTILDRPGVPASTFGCSNNNFFGTTLNDDGGLPSVEIQANPAAGPCNSSLAFPVGSFSPNNPLSAFDTQNADGNWTVNISDNTAVDTGSIRAFSMVFNSGN